MEPSIFPRTADVLARQPLQPAACATSSATPARTWTGAAGDGPKVICKSVYQKRIIKGQAILVGGLEHEFYFPIYWESHHPNWLSYFSEGWPNHQPDDIWFCCVWNGDITKYDRVHLGICCASCADIFLTKCLLRWVSDVNTVMSIPRCSMYDMYGIFTHIYPKNSPHVGKYSIHGASGIDDW